VFVRAFDRRQLIALDALDLAGTVREVYESAVMMGLQALRTVGADDARIGHIEGEYRERDLARLKAQTESGDLHALQDTVLTKMPLGERREA
jgi:glutathione-regulated potassium-efflux system protein KefB